MKSLIFIKDETKNKKIIKLTIDNLKIKMYNKYIR